MSDDRKPDRLTRRQVMGLAAASAGSLALGTRLGSAAEPSSGQGSQAAPQKKRLTLSWRLHWHNWMSEAAFDSVTRLLLSHRAVVDEVCLMESPGAALSAPLDYWAQTGDALKRRLAALREAGVPSVGINVWVTLGHGLIPGSPEPPSTFASMVGSDGKEAAGNPCPTRPEFLANIKGKYAAMARAAPDFIWVDDDLRMQAHGPVMWGCFCPVCLNIFGERFGHSYQREELVQALDTPANDTLRKAWVEQNARALEGVCAAIGDGIREVNPKIQTGLMTIGMAFSGYSGSAYDRWFAALRATKARPGQGFYWDAPAGQGMFGTPNRMDLLTKAAEVARQTEAFPAQVTDCQYEYETWPDGILLKSPQTAVNEVAIALTAGGCNGAAFDTLGWGPPYDEYHPLFIQLNGARAYLETVLQQANGLPAAGLWSAWSPQIPANRKVRQGEPWLAPALVPDLTYEMNVAAVLSAIGIPLSSHRSGQGAVLTGRIAETLAENDLRSLLTDGVVMDTIALRVLIDRGLGDLTGVRIGSSHPYEWGAGMTMARMTGDPINGPYKGALHNSSAMQPAAFGMVDVMQSAASGVRSLAEFEDSSGKALGPCMTAFENALGGRVVVSGYSPWWFLHSAPKRHQMLEAVDWISRKKVPVRIVETLSLTPYVRMNAQGTKGIVMLFNTGLQAIEEATILIRAAESTTVRLVSVEKGPAMKRFSDTTGWGVRVRDIPAWSTISLLLA